MIIEIDARDLIRVGERFAAAAAETVPIISAGLMQAAEAVKPVVVSVLADATPKKTGALAASTEGEVSGGGLDVEIKLRQPATSADGIEYWIFPEFGRGAVNPVNKKALAGPGFGPVRHAGPAPAQHYVESAIAAMSGPLNAALAPEAEQIASKIIAVLG